MANMIDIIVNATDNASRQIDRINDSINRLGGSAGKVTGVLAGMSGSIAGLAPAVAGVGALASTFASAGIGAVAFGAVAVSSISGVVEASEEIAKIEEKIAQADSAKERIKYQKELQQVMAGLNEHEKKALSSLQEFQGWWGSFTSQFDPQVFGVMAQGLDLVRNTMTALTPAITSVGNVLNGFLERVNKGFQTESAKQFFEYINSSAGSNLEALLTTAGNLFMGFFGILRAFQPLSQQFNGGMVQMSENFRKWGESLASSQGFQNFVAYVQANTPPLLNLIKNLWSFLVQLVQALAPLGSAVLQVASSFAQWLAQSNFMSTALNLLKQAGQLLLDNLSALKVVLASVVAGFIAFKVISTIVTLVTTAINIFKTLRTTFIAVRTAVMGLNMAFLANPITWVIASIVALIAIGVLLWKNWDTVKAKALELWNCMKQAWEGIKTATSQAITNIITAVTQWASNMWTKITQMWEQIKTAFSNGVTATINLFKRLPMMVINAVIYMVGFVIGLIVGFMIEMASAVSQGITKVVQFFQQLPSRVMAFINNLKTSAVNGFKTMMSNAKSAVNSGINNVLSFFRSLPSKVMSFINNLKNNLVNGFKTMMNNAKSAVNSGINNVVSFFRSLPSKVMSFITSLGSRLRSGFTSMMNNAKSAVSNGVRNIISAVKNFVSSFLSAGKGLLDAFVKGIKNGISKAIGAVKDGMSAIRDFLPFSPAKKGALSDLDKSGESFFPTFADGMAGGLRPMLRMAEKGMGQLNSTLSQPAETMERLQGFNFGQMRQSLDINIQVSGGVEVDGNRTRQDSQRITETVSGSVDDVLRDLRQAIRKR